MGMSGIRGAVTEQQLRDLFKEIGEIENVRIMKDRFTQHAKGYGFVRFRVSDVGYRCIFAEQHGN